jgi:ADP-ribose pyrophosphatase YjhB (NUDIX family)
MGNKQARQIEVIARGAVIEDGKVLLCQNRKTGHFYLPGGHINFGESAANAVAREFDEECGLKISVGECVFVTEGKFSAGRAEHHELNVVFHVELTPSDQAIQTREPDIAFEWVDLAAVTDMDVRPKSVQAWLVSGGMASGPIWISEMT